MYIELFSHKSIVFIIMLEIDWFNSLIRLFINEKKKKNLTLMVFNENTKCNKNFITKRLQTHMIIKLINIIELIAITQYIIFIRISFKFK